MHTPIMNSDPLNANTWCVSKTVFELLSFDWKAQRQKPKILSFLSTTRKDIHSSSKIFENYRLNANAKIPLTENVGKLQSSCMTKDKQ